MPKRYFHFAAAAAISLLATACGGGGGGGGSTSTEPPPTTPPVQPPTELFSISGSITASSSQAVDGDTNDPLGIVRPNDEPASAQPISNPVTLGGYVNRPGSGAIGRSDISGDVDDYFRVELLAGQSITLLVADYQQADADLYLWRGDGQFVDASLGVGEIEELTIPTDGTYLVNVYAALGATNYVLAIGSQNTAASLDVNDVEIVPWQAVVKYRANAEPEVDNSDRAGREMRRKGMHQRAGGRGRGRLMGIRPGVADDTETLARVGPALEKLARIDDAHSRARLETLLTIKSLMRDPLVEYAEPNYRVRAAAVPDDAAFFLQWHYPLIDLPAAWDTTTGNPEVIVAVVDTGILSNHPDIRGQLVAGYDFVRDRNSARDGNGIDPDPEDPGDGTAASSNSYHGTHVSGTVAAAGNNGIGVAGVAYGARLMPLRALGAGGEGTTYDVEQAVRFAAGLENDSGTVPARRADIINLSLGGAPFSQASQTLYRQVHAAGVAIVASAGNEASSVPSYPASYDGVISVSAVDAQRQRTSYSNTGNLVDIAAPGGDNSVDLNGDGYPDGVLSTGGLGSSGDYGYTFLNGTSMAAPHVAGVLALMKSVNPELSPADIDTLLARGEITDDLGAPGRDNQFGHGLINAQKAVFAALQAGGSLPADNPLLSASASTLNFSGSSDTLELELRNSGKGELDLLELYGSQDWLGITPVSLTTGTGLGLYRVTVDRTGLDAGVYAADIVAVSSVNSLTVRVIMSVGGGTSADVGRVYILLYGLDSEEPIAQRSSAAERGRYNFTFENIPSGTYQIFAGSDADNDLLICDAGEACGAWLTIDQPIVIDLDSNLNNIEFPVDYLIAIPTSAELGQSPTSPGRAIPPKPRLEDVSGKNGES